MKSIRFPLHDIQEVFRGHYRCPRCKAIGTWNPHGIWDQWHNHDLRRVRRWMCKWCGLYRGPEGWSEAVYDPDVDLSEYGRERLGVWQLEKDAGPNSTTPEKYMRGLGNVWPWRY